jgi:ubiquitin carboxyl-terminal hydrolase 2/21
MKGALAREFGDLVSEIQRSSNHSAVSPATWKSVFTRWAPRFSGYSQQDAQEFLRAAIDGLHEDLNRVRQQPAYEELKDIDGELVVAQSERWWSHFCARNDSFIFDLFGGQLRSTLSCSKCKSVSIAFDPFMDLSLPIPKPKSSLFRSAKNVTSLEDCLDEFFASETLDHQEKVFCKKCGKHTVMQKRLSLFRFPKVLVLHVKRFATHAVSVSKITTEVTFPTDGLSVSRFLDKETNPSLSRCNSEPKYKLFGVVHHFGTAHGGHYTASGLRKGQWYEFDDSRVSDSSEAALKGDSAYVLFYERVS